MEDMQEAHGLANEGIMVLYVEVISRIRTTLTALEMSSFR